MNENQSSNMSRSRFHYLLPVPVATESLDQFDLLLSFSDLSEKMRLIKQRMIRQYHVVHTLGLMLASC